MTLRGEKCPLETQAIWFLLGDRRQHDRLQPLVMTNKYAALINGTATSLIEMQFAELIDLLGFQPPIYLFSS